MKRAETGRQPLLAAQQWQLISGPMRSVSLSLLLVALLCACFADLQLGSHDPWQILGNIARGALSPGLTATEALGTAIANTLSFALLSVSAAALCGFVLSFAFHWRWLRILCAALRAIHELFWALIFLQIFGLSTLTAILAIFLPYTAIFAKVFAEIIEDAEPGPYHLLPAQHSALSRQVYTRLANAWPGLLAYSRYRLECGIRSSTVLGFVGLPTIGFHLETWFRQGDYSEAFALLYLFFLIIASLRWWLHKRLVPLYCLAALLWLLFNPLQSPPFDVTLLVNFFTHDIVPATLRNAEHVNLAVLQDSLAWAWQLFRAEALNGLLQTLILSSMALVASILAAMLLFPLISRHFLSPLTRAPGHVLLIVLRSTPEYVLAYIGLIWLGPSMLPALLALALHNGAIIGLLIGQQANQLGLRPDSSSGLNRYAYELLPRVYPRLLGFALYRWEIIMRESAILGMLGLHTLGFYIDSAFEDIRLDKAFFLIVVCALLNILVDALAVRLRQRLQLTAGPEISSRPGS